MSALADMVNERSAELAAMIKPAQERGLLVVPASLSQSDTTGPIAAQFKHYALQFDAARERMTVHDKALLPTPLKSSESVRIEYNEGVAKITPTLARER